MDIYINGRFLAQQMMGVQRFAREIIFNMIPLVEENGDHLILLVPKNYKKLDFDSPVIEYQVLGNTQGYLWEQITLPHYLKKKDAFCVNLTNLGPSKRTGYVVIHDLNYLEHPEFYSKKMAISQFIISSEVKNAKQIFTVSNFTKNQIKKYYPKCHTNIQVIGCGYEHMLRIRLDPNKDYKSIFHQIGKEFYLYVGRLSKSKNMNYIIEAARKTPESLFVLAGAGELDYILHGEKIANLIPTGYLSDDELLYLFQKCKAYIFPTLAEGFGLPPLEAVACGCKSLILSDLDVLKEVYGKTGTYINPFDYDGFSAIKNHLHIISDDERADLFSKYSWKKWAQIIYVCLKKSENSALL